MTPSDDDAPTANCLTCGAPFILHVPGAVLCPGCVGITPNLDFGALGGTPSLKNAVSFGPNTSVPFAPSNVYAAPGYILIGPLDPHRHPRSEPSRVPAAALERQRAVSRVMLDRWEARFGGDNWSWMRNRESIRQTRRAAIDRLSRRIDAVGV